MGRLLEGRCFKRIHQEVGMRLSALAAGMALALAASALGADFTWDGATGSSDWSAVVQIMPGVFQNNWGQTGASPPAPGAADNVIFSVNALVTGTGNAQDVTNSATLTFGSGTLTIHGDTITNMGTLTYIGNGIENLNGVPDDNCSITSAATLTGGGEVVLVERFESRITGPGTLTNADNTIRGTGLIDVATLVN
jgi:hypothetical protein